MNKSIVTVLLVLIVPSLICAQKLRNPQKNRMLTFDVALGRTVNGFTYSNDGTLSYRGCSFRPVVKADSRYVPNLKILYWPSRNLAGVIVSDGLSPNTSFVLDLNDSSSVFMENNAATQMFLSPSQRYVVILGEYEGAGFTSVDLNTKRVVSGGSIGPENRIWSIKSGPQWVGNSDVLQIIVNEYCNSYDDPNCTGNRMKTTRAKYDVRIDAATLKAFPQIDCF